MKTTYTLHPALARNFYKASPNILGLGTGPMEQGAGEARLTAETVGQLRWPEPELPTTATQRLMTELGIAFDGRYYRYEEYRYDRFVDAINYAQLIQSRSVMLPTL